MQISKSDYMLFLRQPAWLWLKKNDPSKLPPIDPATQAMFDAGHAFEPYVESLFPEGVTLGFSDFDEYRSLPLRTQQALESGAQVVFQPRFEWNGFTCISDIVSVIEDKTIDLYEIKSSTRVKPDHLYDLAFQKTVLEGNGFTVRNIFVIHVNNQYVREGDVNPKELTTFADVTEDVNEIAVKTPEYMEAAKKAAAQAEIPDPNPELAKLGSKSEWMKVYENIFPPEPMVWPADTRAEINKQEIERFLGELQYPLYFFDYETMQGLVPYFDGQRPYQQVPFQYSLHIIREPGGEVEHREYLHKDNTNPAPDLAKQLVEDMGDSGSIITWNMRFEKSVNEVNGGYIWHTTGSGKTLTSFKASQIIVDNPKVKKVVFVVDRNDLDNQTIREFNSFREGSVDATDNTAQLVRQFNDPDTKLIVTTIQKLNNAITRERHALKMDALKDEKMVFIFDECHRSQFGETHQRITEYFTNHQLFGFTGTPIFAENAHGSGVNKQKFNITAYDAPELKNIAAWINSDPKTIASLKGKVVLIDFWTYSCINCQRTQPYLNAWYDKYSNDGLVIVGVHAPEFGFEKVTKNVQDAVKSANIKYPVALDNDFATWQAYENRFWPAKYLIDKDGQVRYTHFGEGDYAETEETIQALLKESGQTVTDKIEVDRSINSSVRGQTPETYLGYERAERFANTDQFVANKPISYTLANTLKENEWSLGGQWQINDESSQSLSNESRLSFNFSGKEVYLVMSGPPGALVGVSVDGQSSPGGADVNLKNQVTINGARLYKIVNLDKYMTGKKLTLTFPTGVTVDAFTFGS